MAAADLAGATAHVARLQPASGLGARARARLAPLQARHLDLRLEPGGRVLEGDLQLVLEILAARGARAAAAPPAPGEEVLEDVLEEGAEARVAEARADARSGRPEAVEMGTLVGIRQHGVRLVDFLEFLLGLLVVPVAVGMELHRELAVRLFDLGLAGFARAAEDLVVVARHRTQASSSGAAATDTSAARNTRLLSM